MLYFCIFSQFKDCSIQTDNCVGCNYLSAQTKRFRNLWVGTKHKLEYERKETARLCKMIGKYLIFYLLVFRTTLQHTAGPEYTIIILGS